jgi:hypothetical protein
MVLLWRFLGLRRLILVFLLRGLWRYYRSRRGDAAYPGRR